MVHNFWILLANFLHLHFLLFICPDPLIVIVQVCTHHCSRKDFSMIALNLIGLFALYLPITPSFDSTQKWLINCIVQKNIFSGALFPLYIDRCWVVSNPLVLIYLYIALPIEHSKAVITTNIFSNSIYIHLC